MIENQQMITCGIIGEQEVGKTSLINKYFHKNLTKEHTPTIAVQISYSSFECDEGTVVRVKCWDTSGENKYKNMVCYHLKGADIVIIMFDFTNYASFAKVNQWASRLKNQNVKPGVLLLVGNKLDVGQVGNSQRRITRKQVEQKARQINAQYAQISVENDERFEFLNDAFEEILSRRASKIIEFNKLQSNLNADDLAVIEKTGVNPPCQCHIF